VRTEVAVRRQIWEEEIEKRVTTGIYSRIFAPKSSDDRERDLKLQSKIKALVVVGVTLQHLGVELTSTQMDLLKPAVEAIGRGTYPILTGINGRITCFGPGQKSERET